MPLPPNSAAQTYRPTVPSFRPSMPLNMLSDGMRQLCIAGIIRLADEMDLCRDRNSTLGGEEQMISDSYSQLVWRTYAAVKEMELTEKECILYAEGGGRNIWGNWKNGRVNCRRYAIHAGNHPNDAVKTQPVPF